MTTKSKFAVSAAVLLVAASAWLLWQGGAAPATLPVRDAGTPPPTLVQAPLDERAPVIAEPTATATTTERASATPPAAAPTTGSVIVHVRYGDDHAPAVGRTMTLGRVGGVSRYDGQRQRTDDTGTVRYDGILPGRLYISDGHLPGKRVEVVAGQTAEVELDLEVGITVTGIVLDATRKPVNGALVEIAPMAHGSVFPEVLAVTGADGRFTARACYDLCLVGARAFGHTASAVKFLLGKKGNTADIEIVLGPNGGAVEGTVVDVAGKPIANAVVIVGAGELVGIPGSDNIPPYPALTRSDVDGKFRAIGIPAGEQPMHVRATRFAPWVGKCDIVAGTAVAQRVELAAGSVIRGHVRDAAGKAVGRAEITIGEWDDVAHYRELSAADGAFEFTGLAVGELLLRAHHADFGKSEQRVTTSADAPANVDLQLSRGLELKGRVVDPEGQPIAEAMLQCMADSDANRRWSTFARTDAQGRFNVANCPETGTITIRAQAKDFTELRKPGIDTKTADLVLHLERATPATVRIVGSVVGPGGKPVANATVSAYRQDVRQSGGLLPTDTDGRFELGPVAPGTWVLNVRSPEHPEFYSEPRELAANATWDLGTITFVVGGTARVQVIGTKLEGAYVDVTNTTRTRSWATTDADGGYRTNPLAPGDYLLLVSGKGIAAEAAPFTIRPAEETTVAVQMQAGVAQRFRCEVPAATTAEGASLLVLRGEVLVGRVWAPVPPGDRVTEIWLMPGDYSVSGEDGALRGSAAFHVGAVSGPPVTVTLR